MIIIYECRALGEGAITTYFNVLGLTRPPQTGMTHDLLDALQERYHQANQIKLFAMTPSSFLSREDPG
jgi:hypothetical protein